MVRDLREILFGLQEAAPNVAGTEKIKSYFRVLGRLDEMEYTLWVLRNHQNSMFMLEVAEDKFKDSLGNKVIELKPSKQPMSFRRIGKLIGISEKKARALYEEISDKVISTTLSEIKYDDAINRLQRIRLNSTIRNAS